MFLCFYIHCVFMCLYIFGSCDNDYCKYQNIVYIVAIEYFNVDILKSNYMIK